MASLESLSLINLTEGGVMYAGGASNGGVLSINTSLAASSADVSPCEVNQTEDPYNGFYRTAQIVTGMFIYPILCVIGIVGNVLALVVLSQREMATSTNVYLSALAVSDTLKLLNDLLYFIMLVLSNNDAKAGTRMLALYPFAHYIFNMSVCITAWLTVSVAVERYICVCHPSRAKQLCTIPRARVVCTAVFIVMILASLPSAFRYRAVSSQDACGNMTSDIELTQFGSNQSFMVAYAWVLNLLRCIIPLGVLIILNVRIINELRKERVKGKKLSSRNRITLMLIVIIIVFLVCITPDAVFSMLGKGYAEETSLIKGIREITDSLLAVNSAFNFLLYFGMNPLFRSTLLRLVCRCWPALAPPPPRHPSMSVYRNGASTIVRLSRRETMDEGHGDADGEETHV